ncbi:N-acetylneuraminate synthase family protein [Candidatus Pelagibacter sp.]|nr:N-acetylneuraminate synthase family protein [Candidatus Pelagibacter sp.]
MSNRIKIIAEVGPNHNGSLVEAKKYVDKLSKLNIDFIKFQVGSPDNVYSKDSFKAAYQKKFDKNPSIKKMSQKYHLSIKDHTILYKYCKEKGKNYLASFFDLESLRKLDSKVNLPYIKIPSGEILSLDILNYIKFKNKKIILSTGMASLHEIKSVLKFFNKKNIILMHCVSCYPAKDVTLNLNFMKTLQKLNKQIGFSDHTTDHIASIAAIALGASFIEKHVTLSKKKEGPDHHMSMSFDEFKIFVKFIRRIELVLGKNHKIIGSEESEIKKVSRKSIVSKVNLPKNHIIKKENICFKRPGTGISPLNLHYVVGKKTKKRISIDKLIRKQDLK